MKNSLKNYLSTLFTESETDYIIGFFVLVELEPDQVFIGPNSISNVLGFVAEGILKAVETIENGEELIHYFWSENQFFSEADSYFSNTPTRFSVVAALPCTLLCTTKEKLDALEQEIATLGLARAKIGAHIMFEKSQMQETTKKGNIEECYNWFLNNYPTLASRLRLKDIASFINTTPSYLCAVKNKLESNKYSCNFSSK